MIVLYQKLFSQLNQTIPYTVWKSCHNLQTCLEGKEDIDLLVDNNFKEQFENILHAHGFVHASFNSLKFSFIEHYYGFDEDTGQICHIHVYYKIVTGESHLKSYYIPIEKEIISNRFLNAMNIYEASYSDQALIYAMRHYMKRASLVGFLFWAYEKADYLEEYNYIKKGLNSKEGQRTVTGYDRFQLKMNFDDLEMSTGLSEYKKAKTQILNFSNLRRYNPLVAALKSLHNLGIRLWYKVFRIRKNIDKGIVLAVSGVDGSGKSSMVRELHSWLGRYFDVKDIHLGKPPCVPFTLPLRLVLFMYRIIKGKKTDMSDDSIDLYSGESTLKNKNGLLWGMRYLALGYERYRLACIARDQAAKGTIIICDRYPAISSGKMDSPRIESGGTKTVEKMRQYEWQLYENLPKADALIFLNVSIEEAIKRNQARIKKDKETDNEIIYRYNNNQGLDFHAEKVFFVDADHDYKSVLNDLKSIAWECIMNRVERS